MKKIVSLIMTAALTLTLAGCSIAPTDITDLLRPPKLTGEQQAIERALAYYTGTKYLLKYPLKGKYRTAFILHDLDGDGVNEALALYSLENENAGTHIMVLRKEAGAWRKECDISGDGNEVNRIEFGNYDGSSTAYLTVGWTLFNSTDLLLAVYNIQSKQVKTLYKDSFTNMAVLDLDKNGADDMLLLKLNTGSSGSKAQMISYRDGQLRDVADAPLDSTVSSYADVICSRLSNGRNGVFIDGYKGAHSMVTELVYWKDGFLYTPFYNTGNGTATSTFRNVPVTCQDIDGDSMAEIPMLVELPGYENASYDKKQWIVRWCSFDASGKLVPKFSSIVNFTEGYYFKLPSSWENSVTVQSESGGAVWIFRVYNKNRPFSGRVLFTVSTYSQRSWKNLHDKQNLVLALNDNNSAYVVKMGAAPSQKDQFSLPLTEILNRLHLYSAQ